MVVRGSLSSSHFQHNSKVARYWLLFQLIEQVKSACTVECLHRRGIEGTLEQLLKNVIGSKYDGDLKMSIVS